MSEEEGSVEVVDRRIKDALRRIEGQVKGIHRMVEQDRPCNEVVTQVLAARAALDRVLEEIVTSHVDECVATLSPEQARAAISRAIRMLAKAG